MPTSQQSVTLFDQILADFSDQFSFRKGTLFSWSSGEGVIYYTTSKNASDNAVWSLLHEIGHAQLSHKQYNDDLELLMMEVAAWKQAKILADTYHLVIDEHHIEECLDSYRDWLHQRSRCVECQLHSLQLDEVTYECYNCGTRWKVPASRMCVVRKRRLK